MKRVWGLLFAVIWLILAGCGDRDELIITTNSLPNGRVGVAYSVTIQVDGDADEFRVLGELPPNMQLAGDGELFGTPTVAGQFAFTIEALDLFDGFIIDRTAKGFSLVINP